VRHHRRGNRQESAYVRHRGAPSSTIPAGKRVLSLNELCSIHTETTLLTDDKYRRSGENQLSGKSWISREEIAGSHLEWTQLR